jgi:hypothetical protein
MHPIADKDCICKHIRQTRTMHSVADKDCTCKQISQTDKNYASHSWQGLYMQTHQTDKDYASKSWQGLYMHTVGCRTGNSVHLLQWAHARYKAVCMYTLQNRDCTTTVFTTSAVHYIPITAVQCAVHTALPAYKDDYDQRSEYRRCTPHSGLTRQTVHTLFWRQRLYPTQLHSTPYLVCFFFPSLS